MGEAESILKAIWDWVEDDFLYYDDYSRLVCIFCGGGKDDGNLVRNTSDFVHNDNCPGIRLREYAKQQGWTK